MKHNFSFNQIEQDYWEVYEAIKKYYPIGIEKREHGIYYNYPGIIQLEKIVVENTHDGTNLSERWSKFARSLAGKLDKEYIGTTYGQAPSFSSSIVLNKEESEEVMIIKELNFAVSLLGNFYQIYGTDRTVAKERNQNIAFGYESINVVTVSPFEEFTEPFKLIETEIQKRYPQHRIIPFFMGQTIIHGLEVRYLDYKNCAVNQALFNDYLNQDYRVRFKRGDEFYGKDQWNK